MAPCVASAKQAASYSIVHDSTKYCCQLLEWIERDDIREEIYRTLMKYITHCCLL